MSGKHGFFVEENRQQRAGLLLKDVAYRLYADMIFISPGSRKKPARPARVETEEGGQENPAKYHGMFERRARKGQCFCQPYLGCREFSVSAFHLLEEGEAGPPPIPQDQDLGFMLYDLDYEAPGGPAPAFFRARMEQGVIAIPHWNSPEVRR
jgi:CRISPR-associated protein Cas5d